MIEIKIDLNNLRIEVEGHSGYAPLGQDIVCAGVSTLISMLASECRYMESINKLTINTLELESGKAIIDVTAKDVEFVRRPFRMVAQALQDIADSYKVFLHIIFLEKST